MYDIFATNNCAEFHHTPLLLLPIKPFLNISFQMQILTTSYYYMQVFS